MVGGGAGGRASVLSFQGSTFAPAEDTTLLPTIVCASPSTVHEGVIGVVGVGGVCFEMVDLDFTWEQCPCLQF